jgi:hypothetical protein
VPAVADPQEVPIAYTAPYRAEAGDQGPVAEELRQSF